MKGNANNEPKLGENSSKISKDEKEKIEELLNSEKETSVWDFFANIFSYLSTADKEKQKGTHQAQRDAQDRSQFQNFDSPDQIFASQKGTRPEFNNGNRPRSTSSDGSSNSRMMTMMNEYDDSTNDTISVHHLLLRYIYNYHWDEFQELENVCKVMKVEIKSSERILHLVAKDDSEKQFKKALDKFIVLCQRLYPEMHQEQILLKSKTSSGTSEQNLISETHKLFHVIISKCEVGGGYFIYGKRDSVIGAMKFVEDRYELSTSNARDMHKNGSPPKPLSYRISSRTKILVCEGDITEEVVDVIVNPANGRLDHDGGAAGAIVKKGGKEIQRESHKMIKNIGQLSPGQVTITQAGNLPCKYIVHAVGPVWSPQQGLHCQKKLKQACYNSLLTACNYEAQTIAIPAISSGLFGMPVNVCAEALFEAVEDFCQNKKNSEPTLSEIRFLNNNKQTVDVFEREMMKRYGVAVDRESAQNMGSRNTKNGNGETKTAAEKGQRQLGEGTSPRNPSEKTRLQSNATSNQTSNVQHKMEGRC